MTSAVLKMTPGQTIDKFLWKRGFAAGPVRKITRALFLTTGVLLIIGLLCLPWSRWPFWLAFGAALASWNFFSLAYFVQAAFARIAQDGQKQTFVGGQLLRSYLRLFITVFLVYMTVIKVGANPFAIVGGLSLTVIIIPILLLILRNERT